MLTVVICHCILTSFSDMCLRARACVCVCTCVRAHFHEQEAQMEIGDRRVCWWQEISRRCHLLPVFLAVDEGRPQAVLSAASQPCLLLSGVSGLETQWMSSFQAPEPQKVDTVYIVCKSLIVEGRRGQKSKSKDGISNLLFGITLLLSSQTFLWSNLRPRKCSGSNHSSNVFATLLTHSVACSWQDQKAGDWG